MPGCFSPCTSSHCAIIPFGEKKKKQKKNIQLLFTEEFVRSERYIHILSQPRKPLKLVFQHLCERDTETVDSKNDGG